MLSFSKNLLIDGKLLASQIIQALAIQVNHHLLPAGIQPTLRIFQLGNRPDSSCYVANKLKAAQQIGIKAEVIRFSLAENRISDLKTWPNSDSHCASANEYFHTSSANANGYFGLLDQMMGAIEDANKDDSVHGIIVQLPLDLPSIDKHHSIPTRNDSSNAIDKLSQMNYSDRMSSLLQWNDNVSLTKVLLDSIAAEKDVDCLGSVQSSKMYGQKISIAEMFRHFHHKNTKDSHSLASDNSSLKRMLLPCTPLAVMHALASIVNCDTSNHHSSDTSSELSKIKDYLAGKHVVVLGRSRIVGQPLAKMLTDADATVTVCHSLSMKPWLLSQQADIVISAMGRARMVTAEWIKPGATVIDVGINAAPENHRRQEKCASQENVTEQATKDDACITVNAKAMDASLRSEDMNVPTKRKQSRRIVGDVDFETVAAVAGAITPVPGGIGPLTVAMLMSNTVQAAIAQNIHRLHQESSTSQSQ